jgi:DNA-binding response OmpR family regulator
MLIVDDDPMIQDILGGHYQSLGYRVDYAAEGGAALAAMERELPDIVLCDRVMPGVSGAHLLGEIRNRGDAWRQVIFVFVSALTDRRDRYAMLPLEPDGYIDKPVNLKHADQLLAKLLTARRGEPPSAAS